MAAKDLVLAEDRHPWEKQPGETDKAWRAFVLYRDLLYGRTLQKVADELRVSHTMISRWSTKWAWRDRADAFDLDYDRRRREEQETEIARFRREETLIGSMLQAAALERIRGRGKEGEEGYVPALSPAELDPDVALRYVKEGDRLIRLGFGMPTDFTKGGDDWSTRDVVRLAAEIRDALVDLIPEERHYEAGIRLKNVFDNFMRRA